MKAKNPKWTKQFCDRHGKARFYLNKPGRKRVPLPGLPWSPEFMSARKAALEGCLIIAVIICVAVLVSLMPARHVSRMPAGHLTHTNGMVH